MPQATPTSRGARWRVRWLRHFGEALTPHTAVVSLYAVVVGFVSGLVALALLKMIYWLTGVFFYGRSSAAQWSAAGNHLGAWVILIPVIGGLSVGLMIHYWEPTLKGHGIPEAMQAVLMDKSIVRARVAFLKPIATALAIGTGGPFGAEGPIIQTGAALGSLLGQRLRLSGYDRRVLLAAGAAGGMAATFLAPLAGVLVAVELMLFEFRASSFIPVTLACAAADAIAVHFRGNAPMFATPQYAVRNLHELWLFALLGAICGLLALAMTKMLFWLDALFDRLPLRPVAVWGPVIGALVLGLIGYASPRAFGTGYDTIRGMLNGQFDFGQLLWLSTTKFWALVISLGSGTTGGVFAPSLLIGGGVGGAFAKGWQHLFPHLAISSPSFYALVAMAATFGAVARAPFTAVVFLFELSHDPAAVLPLLVGVMIADGVMRLLSADSMMTGKLAARGLVVSQDYVAPQFQLWTTRIDEIMEGVPAPEGERDLAAVLKDPRHIMVARSDSVAAVAHTLLAQHADFAVVLEDGEDKKPLGVVGLADILELEQEMLRATRS